MNALLQEIQRWLRPVKTPTHIQMEMAECGAAALGILLDYHGKYVPLEKLRYWCGVSRNGVNAYNMVQTARHYGLEAEGYEVDFEGLQSLTLPAILYWNYNHFVVLESIQDGVAFINDPATGPRSISIDEFKRCFSQIALEIKPGKDFQKWGKSPSILSRLWNRVKPFKDALNYLFLSQFCLVVLSLALPIFVQIFLDKFIGEGLFDWKWGFLGSMGAVAVITTALTWVQGRFLNFLQIRLAIQYTSQYIWHVLRLPVLFFAQRFGSEIIYRNGLNVKISEAMTGNMAVSGVSLFFMFIYFAIMLQYDVIITMAALFSAMLNLGMLYAISRIRRNAYANLQQELAKTVGVSYDSINHLETMKMTANDSFFFSRIAGHYTKNINASQNIRNKDVWMFTFAGVFQEASNVMLLAIGCWRVMHGTLTIGMLIGLQILLRNFLNPFSQLVGFASELQTISIDLNRVDDVLNHAIDPLVEKRETSFPKENKLKGSVEMQSVSFGYAPLDDPLLDHLNFKIDKGETVALIGGIGSGKSTIAKLISALYAPWSGDILYDGYPLAKVDRETIAHSIAYVDQEVVLFSGTVSQNLSLWNPAITEKEMINATRDAEVYRHIDSLPKKFQTELIENGRNFSEGERQRLEIARALVANPSVLILDEATSALDGETEARILANIRKKNISCLIITHRINTVAGCDRILVLDQGKIVDEGAHEELKAKTGLYRTLLESQEARHE